MTRVTPRWNYSEILYYLPHHPVIRESSLTTTLRVVFNGSAKTTSKLSLHDLLHEGPKLQSEIFGVITRWRRHRYVYSDDVTKSFRQILVYPEDPDLQRILWKNSSEEIIEYQLNTVTYGTRSATYLASRTFRQLAEDEGDRFPEVRDVILNTTYMDDVYGDSDTEEGCKAQVNDVNRVFASGGMLLQKWTCNKPELLCDIAGTVNESSTLSIDDQELHRTLGLSWDSLRDAFFFSFKAYENVERLTKRIVLSQGKLFVQELWKDQMGWDDQLSEEFVKHWRRFAQEIDDWKEVRVPRHLGTGDSTIRTELHGFEDASGVVYGVVVYLKATGSDGEVHISLVSSKSKLAPIREGKRQGGIKVTIQMLELMAASLLSRHAVSVCKTLGIESIEMNLWTDSSVALTWIKSEASKYKQFVKNRFGEIRKLVPRAVWGHVPRDENPADLVFRGISGKKLACSQLWWTGPSWLREGQSSWPEQSVSVAEDEDLERRNVSAHAASAAVMVEA
ncbi:uncharacterized protein LOC107042772 [Diachasma alloeum]|uniref:uncharacterized protein LOC107042772 n=1 Tax=Diachasma alloeum TaxID=454923 RepID=UPI0007385197|nr:uncharacterized protein LOC107042772 [Diachasma alloeum]